MDTQAQTEFSKALLVWYDGGHRDLPWRRTRDPYAIWISEIMLQQTRAETVTGYYARFLSRFPDVEAVADAPEQDVLKAWEGLGYYSRARNILRAARQVVDTGGFPTTAEALERLPGIGAYTAGAIASIAFGQSVPAVDGNVERVISRIAGIRQEVTVPSVRREIRRCAAALVPARRAGDFNNAMMELGAKVCVPGTPDCGGCPVSSFCDAFDAGDADALPIKQRGRAPRVERRGVAILRCGGRVLVQRRSEKLLQGLWQFPNVLEAQDPDRLKMALRGMGMSADWQRDAGAAKHVFTHIVWEMRLHRFLAAEEMAMADALWVDAAALQALPVPTAMKAAKAEALAYLAEDLFH